MSTPVSSMLLVLVASLIGSWGAVFLKAGAANLKRGLMSFGFLAPLAVGILLFVSSSVFFVLGIRKGELSILYPLVALGYIWTLFWSRLLFKEPFTRLKVIGLLLILIGVVFVGLGNR